MINTAIVFAAVFGLCACASAPPTARLGLKLPPSALGEAISVQQQLTAEREGRIDQLEAMLEADADQVSMIGLALGQRVLSLQYDGKQLKEWRHMLLPSQVRGEDVLEDIQLTYWPVDAIRRALPPGWRIDEQGMRRTLWQGDAQVMHIDYTSHPRWNGTVVLSNDRYRYRLTIQSVPTHP